VTKVTLFLTKFIVRILPPTAMPYCVDQEKTTLGAGQGVFTDPRHSCHFHHVR